MMPHRDLFRGATTACLLAITLSTGYVLGMPQDTASFPGITWSDTGLCEKNPTHMMCNTIPFFHQVRQHLDFPATLRNCSFFWLTPHCCTQFCLPAAGGHCDDQNGLGTGACFCEPGGVPAVCSMVTLQAPNLNSNDLAVLTTCGQRCASNPNGCTRPGAVTDAVAGTVCMCYCDT